LRCVATLMLSEALAMRLTGILCLLAIAGSCARRPQMGVVSLDARLVRPAEARALVMFIRPGRYYGKAIGSSLYDGEQFIGLLTNNTVIAHQVKPGKHTFMLLSGQPSGSMFLEADVTAGKAYYVQVVPRSGWIPFRLAPLDPRREAREIETFLQRAQLIEIDEQARKWDRDNRSSAMEKRREGLRKTAEVDRPRLEPEYGVELSMTQPGAVVFSSAGPVIRTDNDGGKTAGGTSGRLRELENLHNDGLLSDDEYREKRRRIIEEF
jgi:hypothetical protein